MALNVKAAMLICVAFIGGMSWAVRQAAVPQVSVSSPLMRDSVGGGLVLPGSEVHGLVTDEQRVAWAQQLERPSVAGALPGLEPESDVLALAPPVPFSGEASPPQLPPLGIELYRPVAAADSGETDEPLTESAQTVEVAGVEMASDDGGPQPVAAFKVYRVARGDTLAKLARREWKSDDPRLIALLQAVNPRLQDRKDRILAGEELLIPDRQTAERVLAGGPMPLDSRIAAAAGPRPQADEAKTANHQWYTIQRKDTLAGIARRLLKDSRRWREIVAMNRELDPQRITPGMRIRVPGVQG